MAPKTKKGPKGNISGKSLKVKVTLVDALTRRKARQDRAAANLRFNADFKLEETELGDEHQPERLHDFGTYFEVSHREC